MQTYFSVATLEFLRRGGRIGRASAMLGSVLQVKPVLCIRDGVVERVGFTGRGCAISQASASLLTDEIKGKPVADVAALRGDDVLDLLGIDISPARLKCAMLSLDTLREALGDLDAAKAEA